MNYDLISNLKTYIGTGSALAYLAAFFGGLLVSFTPCVYPLIPITIGVIGAQKTRSKVRAFLLSLFYVIGIAVTYSILGAIAAFTGSLFGRIQTSPATYFIVGNIFIILGLGALDVFDISFLFSITSKIGARKTPASGFAGSFIIGMVSGLVVGPCTAPALAALLSFVATRQQVIFGITLLFTFALGMGFLPIIVGTFTGLVASLPRAGAWTNRVKKAFGLLLIAIGEYLLIKMGAMLI